MENVSEKIEVNETVNQLETKAEIAVIEEANRVSSLAKEYIAEDQRTQELCKVQHELVAIRINGILQWFGKENFSEI